MNGTNEIGVIKIWVLDIYGKKKKIRKRKKNGF